MQKVRVRKRGKTYSYAFEAGKTFDGKRKTIEKGGYSSKEEAYTAGTEAFTAYRHGDIGITSEKITLGKYLEQWLDQHVKETTKPLTLRSYTFACNKCIIPALGNIILQDLKPRDIDLFVNRLAKEYSKGTVTTVKTVLSTALRYAIYPCELINSNPAELIKIPSKANNKLEIKRTIIDDDKLREINEKYPKGKPLHIVIQLMRYTGMRVSEVCGLLWSDVDLDKGTIKIERQVQLLNGKLFVESPKTRTSKRQILLDKSLVDELTYWKAIQSELARAKNYLYNFVDARDNHLIFATDTFGLSDDYKRYDFVCTNKSGEAYNGMRIASLLKRFKVNAHSFRHTHATKLAEAGVLSKAIAYRLGHSNTEITDTLYTHHTEKMEIELVKKIEEKTSKNMQTT